MVSVCLSLHPKFKKKKKHNIEYIYLFMLLAILCCFVIMEWSMNGSRIHLTVLMLEVQIRAAAFLRFACSPYAAFLQVPLVLRCQCECVLVYTWYCAPPCARSQLEEAAAHLWAIVRINGRENGSMDHGWILSFYVAHLLPDESHQGETLGTIRHHRL